MDLQGCQRPLKHVDGSMIIPGLREMGSLMGAMLQEWEVAMHNAALAKASQGQQLQAQIPAEQKDIEAAGEPEEQPAAAELHVVQDLVQDIKDKPQGK